MECKDSLPYAVRRDKEGINRNIVECKVKSFDGIDPANIVLIETSWNVKDTETSKNILGESVLIETSWNVKDKREKSRGKRRCINRNIVECKVVLVCRSLYRIQY